MRKLAFCLLPMLALALCLTASPAFAQSAAKDEPFEPYDVGDKAPNFKLRDGLSGEIVELKDLLGNEVIALTFMNTTCSACQAEVSLLSKLADKHAGKLKVYLIAVDMRGEKLVKSYAENYKYNVEYLLDARFSVPPAYGFNYTPAMVLLNKSGEIIYKQGGYTPTKADALIEAVESHL